jgi:hypothetical protein
MKQTITKKPAVKTIQEIAENQFLGNCEHLEMWSCTACGKEYRGKAAETNARKHVNEAHSEDVSFARDTFTLAKKMEDLPWFDKQIMETVNGPSVAFEKAKEEFLKRFNENPNSAIQWKSEDVSKAQSILQYWNDKVAYLFVLPETFPGYSIVLPKLQEVRAKLVERIIDRAPRFSSTSGVANLQEMWENEALCSLIKGWSGRSLDWLIKEIEELLKLEGEIKELQEKLNK